MLFRNGKMPHILSFGIANMFILLAFVLGHVAVLELMRAKSRFSPLSLMLLVLFALSLFWVPHWGNWDVLGTATLDLAVAVQVFQTAFYLLTNKSGHTRYAATFMGTLLILFGIMNDLKGIAITAGILKNPLALERLQGVTFVVYVITALGSAFGLFWMSTSVVTAQLEAIAGTDPLTGIPNRRTFLQQCQTELAACKRHGTVCSILMVDLDHFKQINDRYGHAFGDAALCKVTERIAAAIRSMDTLARWGGEEFCVLLPNTAMDMARVVAERVRISVENTGMKAPEGPFYQGNAALLFTVSIGIAVYETAGHDAQDDVQEMVQRADQRLYEAKRTGRNRVV